jgi:hypothetical protein
VDTSQLENELMLRDIKATEAVALSRPAAHFQQRAGLGALGTAPLQPVNMTPSNAAQERDKLKEEVSRSLTRAVQLHGIRMFLIVAVRSLPT